MTTTTTLADAATWAKRALDARDDEHTALVAADALDTSPDPTDPWHADRQRALRRVKYREADAHAAYAEQCETAASSAADHELSGS